jgi:hypothetical protein
MGKNAKKIYEEQLAYQKWCDFILKELDERNKQ